MSGSCGSADSVSSAITAAAATTASAAQPGPEPATSRPHSSGRRELRAELASRSIPTYYRPSERQARFSTLPVRRAEPKRPAGVSARQARRQRVAERRMIEAEWQTQTQTALPAGEDI